MSTALPTFEKGRLMALIAVLSFGLTALFAVVGLELFVPATFVLGFFLLLPLVWLLGEDFPLVESGGDEQRSGNPVATLRERYATGEIDEAEFERRLDRLLETERLEDSVETTDRGASPTTASLENNLQSHDPEGVVERERDRE